MTRLFTARKIKLFQKIPPAILCNEIKCPWTHNWVIILLSMPPCTNSSDYTGHTALQLCFMSVHAATCRITSWGSHVYEQRRRPHPDRRHWATHLLRHSCESSLLMVHSHVAPQNCLWPIGAPEMPGRRAVIRGFQIPGYDAAPASWRRWGDESVLRGSLQVRPRLDSAEPASSFTSPAPSCASLTALQASSESFYQQITCTRTPSLRLRFWEIWPNTYVALSALISLTGCLCY